MAEVTGGYETPHLAFPYSRGRYVEQGSDEHQNSRAQVVIACPVGWRTERPEFGWRFPVFQTIPLDTSGLVEALQQFADLTIENADEYADMALAAIRHMDVYIQGTGDPTSSAPEPGDEDA